jgi:hypothetical protein
MKSVQRGRSILKLMQIKTIPARAIHPTSAALLIELDDRTVSIPWDRCSVRLANADEAQRLRAELSSSGYGIHWPLLDENLAIGPLVRPS